MHDVFLHSLASIYPAIKSQYPGEGRRRWHLRVLQEFWETIDNDSNTQFPNRSCDDDFTQDVDPFDHLLEGQELGILLRTDYTDEEAWQAFCRALQGAEQDLVEAVKQPEPADADEGRSSRVEDSDSDIESTDGIPHPIIKVVDPSPPERAIFQNISNLSALRLLNDVDIRPAPSPAPGETRIHPPNRLVDQGTWQEIYSGMNIWIYDTRSNDDQCVRLVSQEGDIYGTATGDNWRVQGSHICELQFNMSLLGMKINFGGLDRWDYTERRRNLDEASQIIGSPVSTNF